MEVKKGSWKKRFLEIREGSVWICKNDRVSSVISLLSFAPWSTSFFEVGLVLTAFPSFGFGLGVFLGEGRAVLVLDVRLRRVLLHEAVQGSQGEGLGIEEP